MTTVDANFCRQAAAFWGWPDASKNGTIHAAALTRSFWRAVGILASLASMPS